MYKYYLSVVCLCFFLSCSKEQTKERPVFSKQSDQLVTNVKIDTIRLSPDTFSGEGFFRAMNGMIYFFDPIFSTVSIFDAEGEFRELKLGNGEGPSEISLPFVWYSSLAEGKHLFMGKVSDLHVYNDDFTLDERFTFVRPRRKEMYSGEDDIDLGIYGFDLILGAAVGASNNLAVDSKKMIYVPVRVLDRYSPNFNFYTHNYYNQAYTVGMINLASGRFERGFGQWPKDYHDKLLPHFDDRYIAIKEDSIFVSYNASPLIQVYSPYPEFELQYSFGVDGKNIDNNYRNIRSREEKSGYKSDKGFYSHMYYDDTQGLIFRSYIKGQTGPKVSGLQVYKDGVLVADLETPWHFNVIGKIGDYYYADGNQDEENEQLDVYRFKFPY